MCCADANSSSDARAQPPCAPHTLCSSTTPRSRVGEREASSQPRAARRTPYVGCASSERPRTRSHSVEWRGQRGAWRPLSGDGRKRRGGRAMRTESRPSCGNPGWSTTVHRGRTPRHMAICRLEPHPGGWALCEIRWTPSSVGQRIHVRTPQVAPNPSKPHQNPKPQTQSQARRR